MLSLAFAHHTFGWGSTAEATSGNPVDSFKSILNVIAEPNECDLGHYTKKMSNFIVKKHDWSG
jgi:hypothetical protein